MTQSEKAAEDGSAARIFSLFNDIGIINQLSTAMLAQALPDGIHPSHFAILNHLFRVGDGTSPVRIAAAMQVTKNTMTHSLKVLERRRLIEVRPDPDDGRAKRVFLTEAGRRFRAEAIGRAAARFGGVITPEIAEVLESLRPGLTRLRKHLDENRTP